MSDESTEDQQDQREADQQDQDDTHAADDLGDAGKAALKKEREARKTAEKEKADLAKKIAEFEKAEQERQTAAAKEKGEWETIAKQHEEYQKRPKRRFIGARAREYRFAAYVEAWRQKVEKIGNLNYPVEAKEQKIYGKLRMTVSIKADGSLEKLEINHSSGHAVLDEAAQRIVRLAAPFAPFPDNISKDTDILSITRTWTFTKQDSLASE